MIYEFTLPIPPTVNTYRSCVRNRLITSKHGRQYKLSVIRYMQAVGLYGKDLTQRLSVSIILNFPDMRRRDIDNYNKSLLDAISDSHFWVDDSQIDELIIRRGERIDGGNVKIIVRILE